MIEPTDIILQERTDAQLEEFLLFSIVVAGKTAKTQSIKLSEFLNTYSYLTPFNCVRKMILNNELYDNLKRVGLGQYNRLITCFTEVIKLNPRTCTIEDLENIKGIGLKTSRFFLLYTRSNFKCAVLDTHILKWLNEKGVKAPKSTPGSKKLYSQLEEAFLKLVPEGVSVQDFDLTIWRKYAKS